MPRTRQSMLNALALKNAAALIENMDLEQLFGEIDFFSYEENELTKAQNFCVKQIQILMNKVNYHV